ncbi:hypothetical protein AURDEDRAFT_166495 [Auricularia subglabra TFB-10046 SS5]|nr:hypothetical protein AURDEDRAFT_166495 [Auricularia subglabra TFB-10046 SS5]
MRLLALTLATALYLTMVEASFNLLHHRMPATRTESARAVQARQLTRERLVMRSEKLTLANLFGRADCSLPEPSTLACTCPQYELCGVLCRDTVEDPDYCGDCVTSCPPGPVGERGCCAGDCINFSTDEGNCGTCGTTCDVVNGEQCCSGSCADLNANPENCGACGTTCNIAGGETCCDGTCSDFQQDDANCGTCGNTCDAGVGATCCGGSCVLPSFFENNNDNCGACGFDCAPGLTCCGGSCVDISTDENNCSGCGLVCVGICFFGICNPN